MLLFFSLALLFAATLAAPVGPSSHTAPNRHAGTSIKNQIARENAELEGDPWTSASPPVIEHHWKPLFDRIRVSSKDSAEHGCSDSQFEYLVKAIPLAHELAAHAEKVMKVTGVGTSRGFNKWFPHLSHGKIDDFTTAYYTAASRAYALPVEKVTFAAGGADAQIGSFQCQPDYDATAAHRIASPETNAGLITSAESVRRQSARSPSSIILTRHFFVEFTKPGQEPAYPVTREAYLRSWKLRRSLSPAVTLLHEAFHSWHYVATSDARVPLQDLAYGGGVCCGHPNEGRLRIDANPDAGLAAMLCHLNCDSVALAAYSMLMEPAEWEPDTYHGAPSPTPQLTPMERTPGSHPMQRSTRRPARTGPTGTAVRRPVGIIRTEQSSVGLGFLGIRPIVGQRHAQLGLSVEEYLKRVEQGQQLKTERP